MRIKKRRKAQSFLGMKGVLFCGACCVSCFPKSLDLTPAEVKDLTRYRESNQASVQWNGQSVLVEGKYNPELLLWLKHECCPEGKTEDCTKTIKIPLEKVRLDQDSLEIALSGPSEQTKCKSVLLADVDAAELELSDFVPPGFEPRWALGLMAAGPGLAANIDGQFFVTPWLVVQLGIGYPQVSIGGNYGFRFRPFQFGSLRPFFGAFHHYYLFEYDDYAHHAIGARAGVDWELFHRSVLLSIEVDVLFPFAPEQYSLGELQGTAIPWGGITISSLF